MNQFELNQKIEAFIAEKDRKHEFYSPQDLAFINRYEGNGGLGSKGAKGEGLLYEFFTPDYIVGLMWKLALFHGFDAKGNVLEPSLATGRFIRPAPFKHRCYGFEINPVSRRIAELNYPDAKISPCYFETAFMQPPRFTSRMKDTLTWLEGYPFSLVIGNPPYGKYKNKYSSYFTRPKIHQIELFFMMYGLKLLRPGGLLVYITSSNFIRNGISYQQEKMEMDMLANLVDAYRLPPVFKASQVPTDILVFRRK